MISATDYVGQNFGWFSITRHIGSGAEAEVFHCHHLPTQRLYVLRLPAEEDGLWERNGPLLPPVNHVIEHANAIGSAVAGPLYENLEVRVGGRRIRSHVVQLFGVQEGRYLLPVSNRRSLRGAMSFDAVLDIPARLTGTTLFWERIQHMLLADCSFLDSGHLGEAQWLSRWQTLLANNSSLVHGLDLAQFSPRTDELISTCLTSSVIPGPRLEESAIMRILYGVATGAFELATIERSLVCPFFRRNITVADFGYALGLLGLYGQVDWIERPVAWLGPHHVQPLVTLLDGLSRQPHDYQGDRSEFVDTGFPDRRTVEQFDLMLQDVAGHSQPYISINRNPA